MKTVRLDPADPIASVLAWLAELARALGLDQSQCAAAAPPTRTVAAAVRACLADWSRQLRAIVWAEAWRLAPDLVSSVRARRSAAAAVSPPTRRIGGAVGRMVVAMRPFRCMSRGSARPAARPDRLLDSTEAAALKRRTRAVLLALLDPSAVARRLARRIARARVRSSHGADSARRRRPPRLIGLASLGIAHAPELRPPRSPKRRRSTCRTPRGFAAAAPARAPEDDGFFFELRATPGSHGCESQPSLHRTERTLHACPPRTSPQKKRASPSSRICAASAAPARAPAKPTAAIWRRSSRF